MLYEKNISHMHIYINILYIDYYVQKKVINYLFNDYYIGVTLKKKILKKT